MAPAVASSRPFRAAQAGLVDRLRQVPDELWQRRGLFLLIPAVLTAAWAILVAGGGIGPGAIASTFARVSVFAVCIGMAATLVNALLPWSASEGSPASIVATQLGVTLAGVALGGEVGFALFYAAGLDYQYGEARLLVYGLGFVFGALALSLAFLYDGFELRAREGELHAELSRREAVDARLEALQARTNPHFLFNSLNAIAGLVPLDPERAERAIETLSLAMRYALDSTRTPFVSLERELEAAREYLELERLRFGDRLRLELDVEPGLGPAPVPPLSLQPLVENAVRHGIAQREEGGELRVTVAREGARLLLRVDDDGPGPGASTQKGTGTALRDLRSRLDLLYGDTASLDVESGPEGGCRVDLRVPLSPPARRPGTA